MSISKVLWWQQGAMSFAIKSEITVLINSALFWLILCGCDSHKLWNHASQFDTRDARTDALSYISSHCHAYYLAAVAIPFHSTNRFHCPFWHSLINVFSFQVFFFSFFFCWILATSINRTFLSTTTTFSEDNACSYSVSTLLLWLSAVTLILLWRLVAGLCIHSFNYLCPCFTVLMVGIHLHRCITSNLWTWVCWRKQTWICGFADWKCLMLIAKSGVNLILSNDLIDLLTSTCFMSRDQIQHCLSLYGFPLLWNYGTDPYPQDQCCQNLNAVLT